MKKITTILLLVISLQSFAQLTVSKLYQNGAILQRDQNIVTWGTGVVKDTVIVSISTLKDTAYVNNDGNWKLSLPPLTAGGPYDMTIASTTETITITDVYIGDVWLVSGQSNMEFELNKASTGQASIDTANNILIRECKITKANSAELETTLPSCSWKTATSANVGNFSGVAYYFASALQKEINVPIGIINVSYGGSRIEAWMSKEMLGYDETFVTLAKGETERQPTLLYNKMINPLVGIPVKGMLWYQAESNGDSMEDAVVYGEQFKNLITSWRNAWGIGDIPFIWVQLPNFYTEGNEDSPWEYDAWPHLRNNQSKALSLPNTAEVVTIDVGDYDIHPTNKLPVGERLALAARKLVYAEDITAFGPTYKSHTRIDNNTIEIEFDNIGTGLQAVGVTDNKLTWFNCESASGAIKRADATLNGNTVTVTCNDISDIKYVRYAWEYNPVGVNFYNNENLPAKPFRVLVDNSGFALNSFTSSNGTSEVERGNFVNLEWNLQGATNVTLNGEAADSITIMKLMPLETTSYTLHAESTTDNSVIDSTITITIIDPLPIVSVSAKYGNVAPPNDVIYFVADAQAPGGGTVKQVDFYIDGVLVETDLTSPYEYEWTPTTENTYVITAEVTNGKDVKVKSVDYNMYITNIQRIRYEAEQASLSGGAKSSIDYNASNKKYVDATSDFEITFTINVDTAGAYQTIVRAKLNYQSPKEQYFSVNGGSKKSVRFENDDDSQWFDKAMILNLKAGTNTLTITDYWGWMFFDYIDVLGANPPVSINKIESKNLNIKYSNGICNVSIPEGSKSLQIFSIDGKTIYNTPCSNKQNILISNLNSGVYIFKINNNNTPITQTVYLQ